MQNQIVRNGIPLNYESLIKSFFRKRAGILLVFVFGSAVRGRLTPESDIDIAVLFKKIPDAFQAQVLAQSLSGILKREVDLVILNQASPILRMQVLKNGVIIDRGDSTDYCEFFTDTIQQYEDLKRIRRASEENILKGGIYA